MLGHRTKLLVQQSLKIINLGKFSKPKNNVNSSNLMKNSISIDFRSCGHKILERSEAIS